MSEEPRVRVYWVRNLRRLDAPTAAELDAGVPLGEGEEIRFTRAEPDWIVFRLADGVPPEAVPPAIDGWWLDRYGFSASGTMYHSSGTLLRYAPTGRFETREDGAVAEVFEVRP